MTHSPQLSAPPDAARDDLFVSATAKFVFTATNTLQIVALTAASAAPTAAATNRKSNVGGRILQLLKRNDE